MAADQKRTPIQIGFVPPAPSSGSASLALNTAASGGYSSTWLAYGFRLDQAKTLSKVQAYLSSVTTGANALGPNDLVCDVYTGASGQPGTSLASIDVLTGGAPTAAGWVEFTGFALALNADQQYWLVFRNANASPTTNYPTFQHGSSGTAPAPASGGSTRWGWCKQHSTNSGAAWTGGSYSASCGWRLQFSDGTFDGLPVQNITAGSDRSYTGTGGSSEVGMSFTIPPGAKWNVRGLSFYVSTNNTPAGSLCYRLYQNGAYVASTQGIPAAEVLAGGTAYYHDYFASTIALNPGDAVVCTIADAGTTSDSPINSYLCGAEYKLASDASSLALTPFEGTARKVTTTNGGSGSPSFSAGSASLFPFALLLDSAGEFSSTAGSATTYAVDGPSSCYVAQATVFAVAPNGVLTGTITPSDNGAGGTWSPTSLSWSGTSTMQPLTYTAPASATTATLSFTNSASLTNPANLTLSVAAVNVPSTAYTVTGPTSGSTNQGLVFTVVPNGTSYTGTITPSDGGAGGTFSPTSLSWSGTVTPKTVTYSNASQGNDTLSFSSSPSITNSTGNIGVSITAATALTLAQLQGELNNRGLVAGGLTLAPSQGFNNTGQTTNLPASIGAGGIGVSSLSADAMALLSGVYLVTTGTTTPAAADTLWTPCGEYNVNGNTNIYYKSRAGLGYIYTDGTYWYLASTAPGGSLPAGYFMSAAGAPVYGTYAAQGTATGTATVVLHGNATLASAQPSLALDSSGRVQVQAGTGAGQLSTSGGKVASTLAAADVTGNLPADARAINGIATTPVTTINANIGTTQAITFAAVGGVPMPKVDIEGVAGGAAASYTGVAQAGGGNTITLASTEANNPQGRVIDLVGGTGAGQSAYCTSYNAATKVATVVCPQGTGGNWMTPPDGTTQYTIGDVIPAISPAGAVTVGTNSDKAGYSLSQAFPANFASLAIDAAGNVRVQGPFKVNTANGFEFAMVQSTDHVTGYTGAAGTITVTREIGGGSSAPAAGTVAQIGSTNRYYFSGTAADFNGANVTLTFTASGADPVTISINTTP